MMHILPVLFIRSSVAILSWTDLCEYVHFEYQEKSCNLDEYWDTMQKPSLVSLQPQESRKQGLLTLVRGQQPARCLNPVQ